MGEAGDGRAHRRAATRVGLTVVAIAAAAVALVLGAALLGRMRGLAPATARSWPAVSVIVPARDEAASLPALLASLASLRPAAAEVIVVDDGSTDATAAIARAAGASVEQPADPPAGWIGKSWACWCGARRATGDVLVFLDADVTLAADGLGRAVAAHRDGLLSVQPFHRTERASESLSAPFNVVSAMGSGAFALVGSAGAATAFGPCLVTRRSDYFAVGGHAAVAGDVVEDIALAQRYRAHGLPVECRAGGTSVSFRMYPGGVRALVEGWTKNLAAGARSARRVPVAAAVVAVVAAFVVAGGAVTHRDLPAAAAYAAIAVGARGALRRLGRFRWWAWALYPLPLLFFVAVFTRSLWRTHVRRSVSWRGRTIPLLARASEEGHP
jgi:hypothetical protein